MDKQFPLVLADTSRRRAATCRTFSKKALKKNTSSKRGADDMGILGRIMNNNAYAPALAKSPPLTEKYANPSAATTKSQSKITAKSALQRVAKLLHYKATSSNETENQPPGMVHQSGTFSSVIVVVSSLIRTSALHTAKWL
jgi:hypothetical protein